MKGHLHLSEQAKETCGDMYFFKHYFVTVFKLDQEIDFWRLVNTSHKRKWQKRSGDSSTKGEQKNKFHNYSGD